MNVQNGSRISAIEAMITDLYAQITTLKRERAVLLRGRDVVQEQGKHFDQGQKTVTKNRNVVVRKCGVDVTSVGNSINYKDVTLENVISGVVDDQFLVVDDVIENPTSAMSFCIHLPVKTSGLRHPMTVDIKAYIDYFIGLLDIPKRLFYWGGKYPMMQVNSIINTNVNEDARRARLLEDLFAASEQLHSKRVQAMLAMIYMWICNGNMMCVKHRTKLRLNNISNRIVQEEYTLWSDGSVDGDDSIKAHEMSSCRFCLIQRFYYILFNLWRPNLILASRDFVVEYLRTQLMDKEHEQVFYNVLFRTAAIHLMRMLFETEIKGFSEAEIIKHMKKSGFVTSEVVTSTNIDKATKILTLLLTKMTGSPFAMSSVAYSPSQNGVRKSKKLVLTVCKGEVDTAHALEVMYLIYPEIFLRLNVFNAQIVKCDVRKRNLLDHDIQLASLTVNEYVTTDYALKQDVVYNTRYIPSEPTKRLHIDVIASVRAKDPNTGNYSKYSERFFALEETLCKWIMEKTNYMKMIAPAANDTESRTRFMFASGDAMKLGVLNNNIRTMGNAELFKSKYGQKVVNICENMDIYKHEGRSLNATIIVTHPTQTDEIQKLEFVIDLE